MIEKLLNRLGLFTTQQMSKEQEKTAKLEEYSSYLEAAIAGELDSEKPIVVLGSDAYVRDITLSHGKQLIISPFARRVCVQNVLTLGS